MATYSDYPMKSLRVLVGMAIGQKKPVNKIYYSDLAKQIGRLKGNGEGNGRGMGEVLGEMGHALLDAGIEMDISIPHIQSMVVCKSGRLKELPDNGIKEFWPRYPKISTKAKSDLVDFEFYKIVSFGEKWNDVLMFLNLKKVYPKWIRRSSGESVQHRSLKEYIGKNPQIVGAKAGYKSVIEFQMPSLDSIDVLFQHENHWVGAEVKSSVSDGNICDYVRGIYQCVKYRSIMEAMRFDSVHGVPKAIDVVLVLESTMPNSLRPLAKALDVRVIENITPC